MIVVKTPLRVGLLGGGSDMPSYFRKEGKIGLVLNFTIDKYVYVLVKKRHDDYIYLKYSENEIVHKDKICDIKHDFIRKTLEFLKIDFGVEIINWADIPTKGTGLGSSSSFLVGLLHALHTLKGEKITKQQLAVEACHIEVVLCNKPIGYQDQFAAAYGGLNLIEFKFNGEVDNVMVNDCNEWTKDAFGQSISNHFMLFYTGISRESKDILSEQNKSIQNNNIIESMDANVKLAKEGLNLIYERKFTHVGLLLEKNWELKKKFNENISNEFINKLHDIAMNSGATGAKITGAGGGGFLVVAIHENKKDNLRRAIDTYNRSSNQQNIKEMPIRLDKYGSRVLLNVEEETW